MRKKGIGVIYSLEELSKVKDCLGLIAFTPEVPATLLPLVWVSPDYRIRVFNYPKMNRQLNREINISIKVLLSEVYARPYRSIYESFYKAKPIDEVEAFEGLRAIIKHRKSYFNIAIAMLIPLFFLRSGVPYGEPVSAFYQIDFKMSAYKWILSVPALSFCAFEYYMDKETGIYLKKPQEVAMAFMSYMLWQEGEVYMSYPEFFLRSVREGRFSRLYSLV
jgi:hypothetical protein